MPSSSRHATSRKGAVAGAIILVGLLTASLCLLLFHQISSESRAFLGERERRLEERLRLALRSLRLLEDAVLDELGRAGGPGARGWREVEDAEPIVARAFLVVEDEVRWPARSEENPAYGRLLSSDAADTPLSRRLLGAAYERLAAGDRESAIEALQRARARRLPSPILAQAELLMASILAQSADRLEEAAACCDRVLELGSVRGEVSEEMLPWTMAARFRKGELLLRAGETERGARQLLDLVEDLAADEIFSGAGAFAVFYVDRILALVPSLEAADELDPAHRVRASELRKTLRRLQAERIFGDDLHELWLPAVRAARPEAPGSPRRIYLKTSRGPELLICRRERGDPERLVGFLAELEHLRDLLSEPLGALTGRPGGAPDLRVVDAQGNSIFGGDIAPGRPRGAAISAAAAGELPWTFEVSADEALRSYRAQRFLLYGSILAVAMALIAGATIISLRGLARQVELAEMKSQFVANVSHELKTPLTLIRMYSDLLLLGYAKDSRERERGLKIVARETETLGLLIDNILDISRIEAGEKQYRLAAEEPGTLVEKVVGQYSSYLEHKGFAVRLRVEPDLPALELDSVAFSQALRNLLSNAVKYSRERKEIEVRVRRSGGEVAVEVADRGIGLEPGETTRIFDRFYRARREPGAQVAGTGLGLAIVRHAAEGQGGRVCASRRDGGGSIFTLSFPVPAKPAGGGTVAEEDIDRRG